MLEPADQALIAGFLVNKFRGDPALLAPGLTRLEELTGRPTYGVLPFRDDLWLDTEDSLSVTVGRAVGVPQPPRGRAGLDVAVIRLPRLSNTTDVEALACEPGVTVRWVHDAADLTNADVVVLPGTRATVSDLAWLRARGLDAAVAAHAAAGRTVLGVCGGFQMLCRRIEDTVESGVGTVDGLGLLDADITFAPEKTLARHTGGFTGYEIHHGQLTRAGADDWLGIGLRCGPVFGTHWHGLLDNNALRRDWLTAAAVAAGRADFAVADDTDVPGRRDAQLDVLADLLDTHVDVGSITGLIDNGAPPRPTITTALDRLT